MKEKGGHFVRAYALAIAAHALLFLLFAGLIRYAGQVPAGNVPPVEIQLSIPGAGGGGGAGPGPARAPRPSARTRAETRTAPAPLPAPAARTPAPPASAVSPQSAAPKMPAAAPAPLSAASAPPAASPAPSSAPATPDLPGETDWGDTTGGPGGTGSGGGDAGSGGGPPATIADIDPTPIQPISAGYPAAARRLGQQGLVRVRADIDSQGLVADCRILASSGFPSLDNAAVQAVKGTKFLPAKKNGRSIPSSIIIPVRFRLTQN